MSVIVEMSVSLEASRVAGGKPLNTSQKKGEVLEGEK